MNIQDAYEYITKNRPQTVHISGKTSTGKSTFANNLKNSLGYEIIELDQIVRSEIVNNNTALDEGTIFSEVYKNRNRQDWIDQFTTTTREKINQLRSAEINSIIDGAIANPQTLKEVLQDTESVIIYLHPENLDNYIRNLTSRFLTATATYNAGLPSKFWDKISDDDFRSFLQNGQLHPAIGHAIELYAKDSKTESEKRLNTFQENFNNILIVTI